MGIDVKKIKVEIIYHKVIDKVVEEIDINGSIYRLVHPETKPDVEPEEKSKKRNTKDVIGYSESYKIDIDKDDTNKVLMALRQVRQGYKPTTEMISRETGFKKHHVLAILGWLKDEAIIKRTTDDEGTLVYQIVKEDWKPQSSE